MKQELAFKPSSFQADHFGLRVEGRRLHEWLSSSAAGLSNTTVGFQEPLDLRRDESRSGEPLWHFGKRKAKSVSTSRTVPAPEANAIEARLFDARANAKMVAAQVSMYLAPDWRAKVYRQVDALFEADDLQEDDSLLDALSMRTFLRFIIYAGVTTVPSLGISPAGNILSAWHADTRRLSVEFQPNDRCRLAISHTSGDDTSIMSFTGSTVQARSFLGRVEFPLG